MVDGGGKSVPPFIFEWFFHPAGVNGRPSPLTRCTGPTCIATAFATPADAGLYFVTVRGTEGMAARSLPASLAVGQTTSESIAGLIGIAGIAEMSQDESSLGGMAVALLVGMVGGACLAKCCCSPKQPKQQYRKVEINGE